MPYRTKSSPGQNFRRTSFSSPPQNAIANVRILFVPTVMLRFRITKSNWEKLRETKDKIIEPKDSCGVIIFNYVTMEEYNNLAP